MLGTYGEKFISPEVEDLNASSISSIIGDIQGNVGKLTNITTADGLGGDEIYSIFQESENLFWIGNDDFIDRLRS